MPEKETMANNTEDIYSGKQHWRQSKSERARGFLKFYFGFVNFRFIIFVYYLFWIVYLFCIFIYGQ